MSASIQGEVQVNTFTTGNQSAAAITSLANGGYIVSWVSIGQDAPGDPGGIYAQRYDPFGKPLGAEFRINTSTANIQQHVEIQSLSDGGFVAVWHTQDAVANTAEVFARRFDTSGNEVTEEFQVNTIDSGKELSPTVTELTGGNFVITWESEFHISKGYEIVGRMFDSSLSPLGSDFVVSTTTAGDQGGSATTALPDGGFFVTWSSFDFKVFGRRFDDTGTAIGNDFQINTTAAGTEAIPR